MIHRTRGIVFRTVKFSEASVVSKIYTEKFGMQSYIVNSVRSAKAKTKASLLQVMMPLDMEVYHHENRNLNRVKEIRPFYVFTSLLFDPVKSSVGLFLMEILNKCIHEQEANEKLFAWITEKIISMDQAEKIPNDFLLRSLLELSSLLGFFPHGKFSDASPLFDLKEGTFVSEAGIHPYFISPPVSGQLSQFMINREQKPSGEVRRKLLDVMIQYFQLHVPNFTPPKSRAVLEEVFK